MGTRKVLKPYPLLLCATGLSRLTGMSPEAINTKTHSAIA